MLTSSLPTTNHLHVNLGCVDASQGLSWEEQKEDLLWPTQTVELAG